MKTLSALLLFTFFSLAVSSCKDFQSNNLDFDQHAWKTGDSRIRGRMYRSLLDKNILKGKTKDDVIIILGKPDEDESNYVKYVIDVGGIFETWFQKYFLIISFSPDNKVIDIAVVD